MANYSVNTCFHLDWPKEACDSLKTAIAAVLEEKDPNSPEIQSLGPQTQEVIRRFLQGYGPLGVVVEDYPDGGVLVKDENGMFAPHMMADLLSAIMKDHGIEEVVSFTWSEDCDKHRLNAFAGGGAVVSANEARVFHVSDLVKKIAQEMREEFENSLPAP